MTERVYITTGADKLHRVSNAAPVSPPHPVIRLDVASEGPVELPAGPLDTDQLNTWLNSAVRQAVRVKGVDLAA